jgi:hypothetical protein
MTKWKDLEGNGHGRIEVLSCNLHRGTEKTHESSVRISDVPAKIRTENLPNMGLDRYRQTNLFSSTKRSTKIAQLFKDL